MKIFPENGALAQAATMMCVDSPSTPRQNKLYGWVKRKLAEHNSVRMKEWHQNNVHPMQGRKHSEEAKARIGASWNGVRKQVFCFDTTNGNAVATYRDVADAARAVGLHPQTIYSCIRVPGKRTAGGFSWSYENRSPGKIELAPDGRRVKWKLQENDCKKRRAWNNCRAHKESWAMADKIAETLSDAVGFSEMVKHAASPNTVYRIGQKIKSGWNPLQDNEWKEWKDGRG